MPHRRLDRGHAVSEKPQIDAVQGKEQVERVVAILVELALDIRESHPDTGVILSRHDFSSRPVRPMKQVRLPIGRHFYSPPKHMF
jgi:hypothetical protein